MSVGLVMPARCATISDVVREARYRQGQRFVLSE